MSAVVEAREPSAKYLSALQPPLVQHFDLMVNAAGGVERLRDLVLELAVSGKLFGENCTTNWREALLGDIGDWGSGGTPSKSHPEYYENGTIPWLVIGDLNDGIVTSASTFITELGLQSSSAKVVPPGTLLVAMYGSIGKLGVTGFTCATNQAIAFCQPDTRQVSLDFLFIFLRAIKRSLLGRGQGLAQQNISQKILKGVAIRLPPIEQQTRIVTRVEELMRLCDALEAKGRLEAAQHAQLVQTLLGALTVSTSPDEVADNWQRVATHFDVLLDRPEAIDALEQTILQLAVRGLLVPQDPKDEPASELLKKIRVEKDRLIAEGKIKLDKPPTKIVEEVPFEVPPGWTWTTLNEICALITDGTHQTPKYTETGRPFLSAKNVKPFRFMPEPHRFVSDADFHALRKGRIPNKGDILMTRVGAMIGEAAVIDQEIEFAFYVSLALLGMPGSLVSSDFLATWLNSPFGTANSVEKTLGRGVSAGNLNLTFIRSFAVPLPPAAEQHRIIERLGSLRRRCADLRQRLAARQTTQALLAEALIDEVA